MSIHSGILGLLGIATISTVCLTARAAATGSGTIVDITIDTGTNHARIQLSNPNGGVKAACANASYPSHFGLNLSTVKDEAIFRLAMSAQLAGKSVTLTGTNACVNVGNAGQLEGIGRFTIYQ